MPLSDAGIDRDGIDLCAAYPNHLKLECAQKKARTATVRAFHRVLTEAASIEMFHCYYGMVRVTVVVCVTPPPVPFTVIG